MDLLHSIQSFSRDGLQQTTVRVTSRTGLVSEERFDTAVGAFVFVEDAQDTQDTQPVPDR